VRSTQTPYRLAILADDLTGAADSAAPFAEKGVEAAVAFRWPPRPGIEVLALVTDSRWRAEADAIERTKKAVVLAREWGAQGLFVKVDSTMRGNPSTDVAAALEEWKTSIAIVAPSFPAQGRTIRDGVLRVRGRVHAASVADYFPSGLTVLDAETDEHLRIIATRVLDEGAVAVGSAGLARALASVLLPGESSVRRSVKAVQGVLVVVGTRHPVTRTQATVLARSGALTLVVKPSEPVDVEEAVARLRNGGRVLVMTEAPANGSGGDSQEHGFALGQVVRRITSATPQVGIVVSGGATAFELIAAVGADEYRVLAEVSPGVALGEILVGGTPLATVTKSGGFGDDDGLLDAVKILEAGP
jgi:uncharacterized protein YgbK (DUF1537 family)